MASSLRCHRLHGRRHRRGRGCPRALPRPAPCTGRGRPPPPPPAAQTRPPRPRRCRPRPPPPPPPRPPATPCSGSAAPAVLGRHRRRGGRHRIAAPPAAAGPQAAQQQEESQQALAAPGRPCTPGDASPVAAAAAASAVPLTSAVGVAPTACTSSTGVRRRRARRVDAPTGTWGPGEAAVSTHPRRRVGGLARRAGPGREGGRMSHAPPGGRLTAHAILGASTGGAHVEGVHHRARRAGLDD
jgi:hypothetical protein